MKNISNNFQFRNVYATNWQLLQCLNTIKKLYRNAFQINHKRWVIIIGRITLYFINICQRYSHNDQEKQYHRSISLLQQILQWVKKRRKVRRTNFTNCFPVNFIFIEWIRVDKQRTLSIFHLKLERVLPKFARLRAYHHIALSNVPTFFFTVSKSDVDEKVSLIKIMSPSLCFGPLIFTKIFKKPPYLRTHKYRFRLQKGVKNQKHFFIFEQYIVLTFQRIFDRLCNIKTREARSGWSFISCVPYKGAWDLTLHLETNPKICRSTAPDPRFLRVLGGVWDIFKICNFEDIQMIFEVSNI